MPAAAGPPGPAGAANRGAVLRGGARHRRGAAARHRRDPRAVGARRAGLGAALVRGSRLGRAGRDPEHRHERRPLRRRWPQWRGEAAANALYLRFVQAYSRCMSARLDAAMFDVARPSRCRRRRRGAARLRGRDRRARFRRSPRGNWPRCCARWRGPGKATSARLLRQARGAPADAGLGLVVQEMALGLGAGRISGSGVIQFVDRGTGTPQITGRYLSQARAATRCRPR